VATRTGRPELADIVRAHGDHLVGLTAHERRVLQAIGTCRTAALGGHVRACDRCGHREISFNSCRNRHCPKCQGLDRVRWQEARAEDLLPVPYFHLVFTVSDHLHPLFLANPRVGYDLLFRTVAQTLEHVAADPRHLGARIGFTALLHTWTQRLLYHPHLHVIVPGGGLAPGGERWVSCRPAFFVPVRVLSTVFRGKLLSALEDAGDSLVLPSGTDRARLLKRAGRRKWVVYAKPPFAGPESVLRYLGRYTHRIAIGNERIVHFRDGEVTFRYRDRARGNAPRRMTLDAQTFLRRFLLHVLPPGFVRVRHYGLLANAVRRDLLPRCRALLGAPPPPAEPPNPEPWEDLLLRITGKDVLRCPVCGEGRLHEIEVLPAAYSLAQPRPCGASP